MRPYATVSPLFWTGSTGKKLRKNPDAQRIALYLMTCPHSHQTGVYYLPMMYLCNEVGIPEKGASKALAWLSEEGFAKYDNASEWVWVCEMASWQIGSSLTETDKRCKGVQQYISTIPSLPFVPGFRARYSVDFHLVPPLKISPLQGATEGASSEQSGTGTGTGTEQINGASSALPTDVTLVFDHWRQIHNHPQAKLDAKRLKLIRVALAAYAPEQLCAAISGYKNSAHHMGHNDSKAVYDDIELFLRDAKHIDAGLKFAEQGGREKWQ
jgi:hypothetical protein